ncbi:MAG: sensor histidine kinase, partial [Bacteroidota bacterium]
IDGVIADVRQISINLRPTTLDDFGLVTALKLLCKEFERSQKAKVVFQTTDGLLNRYDSEIEIALFRIAQEALTNAVKHARASKISVQVLHIDKRLQLIVEDNGKGFHYEDPPRAVSAQRGLGLLTMKERAELLSGRYRIETEPKKGTRIVVEIPFRTEKS